MKDDGSSYRLDGAPARTLSQTYCFKETLNLSQTSRRGRGSVGNNPSFIIRGVRRKANARPDGREGKGENGQTRMYARKGDGGGRERGAKLGASTRALSRD